MSKILVKPKGLFIGDLLFSTAVAEPLHRHTLKSTSGLLLPTRNEVHFSIEILQPYDLLSMHPYIDKVFFGECEESYDEVIELGPLACQDIPATLQFKKQAEEQLKFKMNDSANFHVETHPENDYVVNLYYKEERAKGKKVVAWQKNWVEKSFGFTKEEYWKGVDVPNLGYGGRRRDIGSIVNYVQSQPDFMMIPVGLDPGVNHINGNIYSSTSYAFTASLIKMADVFIGSEGGLSNLANGVRRRSIITTDFIAQLYAANGCIRKHLRPTMGPAAYNPELGHVHLDPYLSDKEVAEQICYYIRNPEKYHVFDWSTL